MSRLKNLFIMTAAAAAGMGEYDVVTKVSGQTSPIYYPPKHTKQSYRSQQRARIARNKARGKKK